jgi:hypothetical protein
VTVRRMVVPPIGSTVEVRVQHADLGDAVDGELVGLGGPADGLGAGAVIDAERHLLVGRHIRLDPGDPLGGVAVDDDLAGLGPALVDGMLSPSGKLRSTRYRGMVSSLVSGSLLQTNQLRNGRTSSSKPGLLRPI